MRCGSRRLGPVLLEGVEGHVRDPVHHHVADAPLVDEPEQVLRRDVEASSRLRRPEGFSGHRALLARGKLTTPRLGPFGRAVRTNPWYPGVHGLSDDDASRPGG